MRIVLFHGYGSNGADLRSLAPFAECPDGPLALDWGGRAWFSLGFAGDGPRWSEEHVRDAARPWIERVEGAVIGGFSQGGAMVHALLAMGAKPSAAIVMSGFPALSDPLPQLPGLPILVTHGRRDPVVPFRAGEELVTRFGLAGATVERSFDAAEHTVSQNHLEAIMIFLSDPYGTATPD